MQKVAEYLRGVRHEMAKVTWPAKEEVVSHTALVVVFSLVLSLVVGLFDYIIRLLVAL